MLDASVPCQPGIWVTNPTHNIACNTLTYVFAPLGLPAHTGVLSLMLWPRFHVLNGWSVPGLHKAGIFVPGIQGLT